MAYLYIESHHEWIFMRLGGSDSPGDLSPDVAADLPGFVVADLGLEFGPQTGVLVRAPGKGLVSWKIMCLIVLAPFCSFYFDRILL